MRRPLERMRAGRRRVSLGFALVAVGMWGFWWMGPHHTSAGRSAFIVAAVIGVMVLVALLVRWAATQVSPPRIGPMLVFVLQILYLVALLASIVLYNNNFLDIQKHLPPTVAGVLPLAVPWFGAIGAVMLSLQGVFDHIRDWDYSYSLWHISRPIVGATLAIVAYFIYVILVQTSASTAGPAVGTSTSAFIYYVVSILVGFREKTFRRLIQDITDVILGSGETSAQSDARGVAEGPPGVTLTPSLVDHGSCPPDKDRQAEVELVNASGVLITVTTVSTSKAAEWTTTTMEGPLPGRVYWTPGSPAPVASGSSLWIRTRWQPLKDADPGTISRDTLTVAYSGFEGSPKTAVLTGTVGSA